MISDTYENRQIVERLAPAIRVWLDSRSKTQRRAWLLATSGEHRTYVSMAKELRVSATRTAKIMNSLRRGGTVVLDKGLKDAGLPRVDYDVTWCPWSTLRALQKILDAGTVSSDHAETL